MCRVPLGKIACHEGALAESSGTYLPQVPMYFNLGLLNINSAPPMSLDICNSLPVDMVNDMSEEDYLTTYVHK